MYLAGVITLSVLNMTPCLFLFCLNIILRLLALQNCESRQISSSIPRITLHQIYVGHSREGKLTFQQDSTRASAATTTTTTTTSTTTTTTAITSTTASFGSFFISYFNFI